MKINLLGLTPVTMHRIQMVCGMKKKNMERVWRSSVCLCVQALPEVAVCVVVLGGVQVLR